MAKIKIPPHKLTNDTRLTELSGRIKTINVTTCCFNPETQLIWLGAAAQNQGLHQLATDSFILYKQDLDLGSEDPEWEIKVDLLFHYPKETSTLWLAKGWTLCG